MLDKQKRSNSYYVITILFVIYTLNFVDRQLISVASPILKLDLGLSDTQLGLLKGFAFAFLFSLAGISIARMADRHSRVNIIAMSLSVWSAMTLLTGYAHNFIYLLLTRAGLGLGEAGCSPATHSLLSDYFPKRRLYFALSIYSLGIPLGNMFAFLIGGLLIAEVGWRATFVLFGLIGLLLALLLKLSVNEPTRKTTSENEIQRKTNIYDDLALLWKIPSYRVVCIGAGVTAFGAFGLVTWITDFFARNHPAQLENIGIRLALVYGISGGLGMLAGGFLSDKYGQKHKAAYLLIPGSALIISTPFLLGSMWASNSLIAYSLLSITVALTYAYQAPIYGLAQTLAPTQLKAQSAAIVIAAQNLIGVGLGPLSVGVFSDFLSPSLGDAEALRIAVSLLCIPIGIAGIMFLISASKLSIDIPSSV